MCGMQLLSPGWLTGLPTALPHVYNLGIVESQYFKPRMLWALFGPRAFIRQVRTSLTR